MSGRTYALWLLMLYRHCSHEWLRGQVIGPASLSRVLCCAVQAIVAADAVLGVSEKETGGRSDGRDGHRFSSR